MATLSLEQAARLTGQGKARRYSLAQSLVGSSLAVKETVVPTLTAPRLSIHCLLLSRRGQNCTAASLWPRSG